MMNCKGAVFLPGMAAVMGQEKGTGATDCTGCEWEEQDKGQQPCPSCYSDGTHGTMYTVSTGKPIADSGDRTEFGTGAVRDMGRGKGRFDLLPMCVLMRLAGHYEKGAAKYGERNWEKGIPAHSFADSAMRHLVKYLDGWDDEDHLIAAIWNLCGLAWTEEKKPEMMDIKTKER